MHCCDPALQEAVGPIAAEADQVSGFLRTLGATDGEYLQHVIQTLLQRHQNPRTTLVSLLVSHAVAGTVPREVVRFAAAVQITAVAGLAHHQTVAGTALVPAEQPAIDSHLVVLAGDYLYSQAAYITAGLQNLTVMGLLAAHIKAQCREELLRQADPRGQAGPRGLYTLSALGTAHLLGCDDGRLADLQSYGDVLDAAEQRNAPGAGIESRTPRLLAGFAPGWPRSRLLDLVHAMTASTVDRISQPATGRDGAGW